MSTYRWWARRTQAVYGALLDHIRPRGTPRLVLADVYSGGGAIALAGVLRQHQVYAQDINPWAIGGLNAMLGPPPSADLEAASRALAQRAAGLLAGAYATTLASGGVAEVGHTLRVAYLACPTCRHEQALFPHALVTLQVRRDRAARGDAWFACRHGHLFQARADRKRHTCPDCRSHVHAEDTYSPSRRVTCTGCGGTSTLAERAGVVPWRWEVALVERVSGAVREITRPTDAERAQATDGTWTPNRDLGPIPDGVETRVLRRHGYRNWHELYPARQRYVLEQLLALVPAVSDHERVVRALRLALVSTAEMAGYLSRWDRFYLKSYEAMAGHRFNLTTLPAEPNVWGAGSAGRGTASRRIAAAAKASRWMAEREADSLSVQGPEQAASRTKIAKGRHARLVEGSSERVALPADSVDLVLTDPPYHDDVQYGELSLPLRAWAGMDQQPLAGEALFNRKLAAARTASYEDLLTTIFKECHRVLKADGRLVLGYSNRDPAAWVALFAALEESGFRAFGCEAVEAENDSDYTKRGLRACTHDLIMDLTPDPTAPLRRHAPRHLPHTDEGEFLALVAAAFLKIGIRRGNRWRATLTRRLRGSSFITDIPDAPVAALTVTGPR
ncbi:MAG: hypothetical protein ACJ72N_12580 [Labedaea sp.]